MTGDAVTDTTPQIAERALKLLKDRGWRQGTMIRPGGPLCIGEALLAASRALDPGRNTLKLFSLFHPTGCGLGLPEWNDHPGRTWEDIEAALKDKL